MNIAGAGGLSWQVTTQAKSQTGQNVPAVATGTGTNSMSGTGGGTGAGSIASTQPESATQKFMDYMNETPAQRMEDTWLAQHGMTRAQFNALSPEKKQAVMKQMQQDLEQKIKDQAQSKAASSTNILA